MTLDQLLAILPACPGSRAAQFLAPLNAAMAEFGVTTPARQAAFIAQCGHESGQLRYVRELWGPTPAQKGYDGRKDLGNTWPGDGHKYLGRGLIQTTGRANYIATGKALGLDLVEHPELLEEPVNACRSAGWFWQTHGLNELADEGDFLRITKKINGGTNGFADREALHEKAQKVLA